MTLETVDHRILGALRCREIITGAVVESALVVRAPGLRLRRNRSHAWAIVGADDPALGRHLTRFTAPPDTPALGSVAITVSVQDPAGRWLPRTAAVTLPRDPDGDLFTHRDIALYPSPAFPCWGNWAPIRAHVVRAGQPVRGALLRVVRTGDGVVLARGLSDARGEALAVVAGLALTTFASGEDADGGDAAVAPVTTQDTAATLDALFDPALTWPLDPDDLDDRRGSPGLISVSVPITLRAGISVSRTLTLP